MPREYMAYEEGPMKHLSFITVLFFLAAAPLAAGPFIDVETGPVFTGMNDIKINGRWGTGLSLPGTLGNDPTYFIRARAGYTFLDRHSIYALAAPLKVDYAGTPSRFIVFRNRIYFPYAPMTASVKFNSFRLTYRYDIVRNDTVQFGLGLTGKIRDAYVRLRQTDINSTRTDLGFVPLITVRLQWLFVPQWSLLIDADWLVGPVGRAEDALVAVQYHINKNLIVRAGYRILEGGADNKQVYTFQLYHYAVVGLTAVF